jgi:hypothetical protein
MLNDLEDMRGMALDHGQVAENLRDLAGEQAAPS